jgi:hypothetical protein
MSQEITSRNPTKFASILLSMRGRIVARPSCTAQRAEAILDRIVEHFESGYQGFKPDTICFSSVINAWSKSGDPTAPQKAGALLAQMQKMHEAGDHDVKPDTILFTTVISVWARSGGHDAGIRANRYLAYMKKVEALGHKDCGPNEKTYETFIRAWSISGHPDADRQITPLQKEMKCLVAKGGGRRK